MLISQWGRNGHLDKLPHKKIAANNVPREESMDVHARFLHPVIFPFWLGLLVFFLACLVHYLAAKMLSNAYKKVHPMKGFPC